MKISINCMQCLPDVQKPFIINLPPTNDGLYEFMCPNGHTICLDFLCNHFQILFENAIYALVDGYYIEALSSFASSYERFMEFFIQVVSKSRGVAPDELKKTWKLVASQSERQLGAFIIVFMKEFGKELKLLSKSSVGLRNKVIHKGYFPSKGECIKYGEEVLQFILPIIKTLSDSEIYNKELLSAVNDTGDFDSGKYRIHYYHYPMIGINRNLESDIGLTVEKLIEKTEKIKNRE